MLEKRGALTLGIDIDGTVTEPNSFIPYLNKAFKKNLTLDDIVRYELHPLYGVSEDEMATWFDEHSPRLYAASPPRPEANRILRELSAKHRLIYISARANNEASVTYSWFKKHSIPYDAIHLIGSHRKIEKAREQRAEVFFEDKYDNACDLCEELSIPVILFDTPYNQGPLPEHVYRVQNWYEVPPIVEKAGKIVKNPR